MQSKSLSDFNVQGIVLIDEIETHLHIDLHKKVLPFLMAFFPKIQFIVTTHSPFVLTSVKGAVIYDLETNVRVEDLSAYSFDSVVEGYFDIDNYSLVLKAKIEAYETLLHKENWTEEDEDKLLDFKHEFENLPTWNAPELSLKIQELKRLFREKMFKREKSMSN